MSAATPIEDFATECGEILGHIEQCLQRIEGGGGVPEFGAQLRRYFHTIKGNARFVGLPGIAATAHAVEGVLGDLDSAHPDPELLRTLWQSLDEIHEALARALGRRDAEQHTPSGAASPPAGGERVGEVLATLPDSASAATTAANATLRVAVGKLDLLVGLATELVHVRNQLANLAKDPELRKCAEQVARGVAGTAERLHRITYDLQRAVLDVRLVRVHELVREIPRQVRSLARQLGKSIRCRIEGAHLELDTTLVERLRPILAHLVANACDHGIESPAQRAAVGKPVEGSILLCVVQEENYARFLFEDDGAGVDLEAVRTRALRTGLLRAEHEAELSEERLLALIFESGFSTREEVTETSGRGVGLDAVRNEVESLHGTLAVHNRPGGGMRIDLRIPLKLFVVHALHVAVEGERYVLPSTHVLEVRRTVADDSGAAAESRSDAPLASPLPLLDLPLALRRTSEHMLPSAPRRFSIVISHLGRRGALAADQILGQEEIVVRALPRPYLDVPGYRGLTVLGDGSLVPVLDAGYLLARASS